MYQSPSRHTVAANGRFTYLFCHRRPDSDLSLLCSLDQPVVIGVRSDPEPNNIGAIQLAQRTVAQAYAHRVGVVLFVHFLEIESRVGWSCRNNW